MSPTIDPPRPLVSIVLPTYKRAHVLPGALSSVLAQTYTNFELIVVSDNSPDDTDAVVRSFADPRVRYYRNETNLKLPRTLNRGFSLASGDYLTWTSDDNLYAPGAIARMVAELEASDADFVFADYDEFSDTDADGAPSGLRHVKFPDTVDLAQGNAIGACFLYRRRVYETVGDYDVDLFLNEDYDYWLRVARAFSLTHIAEPLYYFRRNEESLYVSHFCEVRAGSLLVRYKNRYVGVDDVLQGVVQQIMANLDRHTNRWVRVGYRAVKRSSYRLATAYEDIARRMLQRRLRPPVERIIAAYDGGGRSFTETKLALSELMSRSAAIEYRSYVRPAAPKVAS